MVSLARHTRRTAGFTVIELLVVLAAIGLLLAVTAPRYVQHLDRARETALRHNLRQVRDAIDKFKADQDRYPADLKELVTRRYLSAPPRDPLTEREDTWLLVTPGGAAGLVDLRSGAPGVGMDGTAYGTW